MSAYTTTYRVDGVNSAHCKGVVTKALGAIEGVEAVDITIGTGLVTVPSATAIDDTVVEETVEDAGYDYRGRA
ncbi:heavy-metal-associated domain-containing protein [Streptomyces sp. NPDC059071]|uniref:heavy-metal-associated domain-containing protein n=1 Tax=unclassified Streptomyces TaxID=2593676 RepID=UPI0036539DCA